MPNNDSIAKLWWAVPAGAFLLLVLLIMAFGGPPEKKNAGTSYDASSDGFRAAYLLLEELGYPVYRAKHPGGPAARWALYPSKPGKETAALDAWLQRGGILLLADSSPDFARALGISLEIKKDDDPGPRPAEGLGVETLDVGPTRVDWPGQRGEAIVKLGAEPVVSIYHRGSGQLWLVHRPELVTNGRLRQADNAVLVCRLATRMLEEHPGRLAFDEYCHGMRERPGVTQLLFQPPTLWATCHGLALLGLLLWRHVPRFGAIQSPPAPSRRSKEEFLDALATLLESKGDVTAACRVVRDCLARELESELGLPPGAPPDVLAQAVARRRPIEATRLLFLLSEHGLPAQRGSAAFLAFLNELESIRNVFFTGRRDR